MKILLLLLLIITLSYCGKPAPTFNPFDSIFAIDTNQLREDSTITRIGDCMAYMYSKDHGDHETYYGVYLLSKEVGVDSFVFRDSVVSKGVDIPLNPPTISKLAVHPYPFASFIDNDTLWEQVQKKHVQQQNAQALTFKQKPFDTVQVDAILQRYGLTRGQEFTRTNKDTGRKGYFLMCNDSLGKEYLFQDKIDFRPLTSERFIIQRILNFDTRITLADLDNNNHYY